MKSQADYEVEYATRSGHDALANARAVVTKGELRLSATEGYADVLLGEQTRRRARALAETMGLSLAI